MLVKILALVDLHTLFVLIFYNYLPFSYVLAGSTFMLTKGLLFSIPDRDVFSFIDILVGCIMFFLVIGSLYSIVWWAIFFYLIYKITMSFAII